MTFRSIFCISKTQRRRENGSPCYEACWERRETSCFCSSKSRVKKRGLGSPSTCRIYSRLLQSKEDRWNPGAGSPMGLPAGVPHQMLPDRGDKGCGVCAGIPDPAVVQSSCRSLSASCSETGCMDSFSSAPCVSVCLLRASRRQASNRSRSSRSSCVSKISSWSTRNCVDSMSYSPAFRKSWLRF